MSPIGSTSPYMRRAVVPEVSGVMIAAFRPKCVPHPCNE